MNGMNGESNMETYTLPTMCKTDSQWEPAVWLREWKPGLHNNPEEWDGVAGSRGRGHTYTYGRLAVIYGRGQHNILRQFSFN